jgi:hypothetical protein
MATKPRLLFPDLPPELRIEIYQYLSAPESTSAASTIGIPLKLRTYECKHTTVQICPVHYGSTGLCALQTFGFEEAREYGSWLLNNAIELRIGVTFKGRVNTFVQQDWDKKMEAHLRKLAKLHPWLEKVSKYNIQVLWCPIDGVVKSKKNKRTAGQIPRDMAATFMGLVDGNVKKKKGQLNMKLCIDHKIAVETVLSGTRFGFTDFFPSLGGGFKMQTIEVWKEAHLKSLETKTGSLLLPNPPVKHKEKSMIDVEKGLAMWTVGASGHLVMRKHLADDVITSVVVGNEQGQEGTAGHIVLSLLGECLL